MARRKTLPELASSSPSLPWQNDFAAIAGPNYTGTGAGPEMARRLGIPRQNLVQLT